MANPLGMILGCVVRMVVVSMLPHAECGPNDHRKDAPPFRNPKALENHESQVDNVYNDPEAR